MIAGIDPLDGLRAMLSHDFIRHAFLAGTFIAAAAGLVGYFVVLRNQVFAGDALSHVAFTGALAALAFGIDPLLGLFAATILVALGMGALGGRARSRDVVVGTVFAWILGLGVLFLSVYTTSRSSSNGAVGVNVLFGSIYGLSLRQAVVAAAVGTGVTSAVVLIARPLLFASVDSDVAAARGLPVRLLGLLFLALVGVTVAEAVQAVGALLIFGLLVTPAATAQRLTARPFLALALSMVLSVAFLWTGLTLSYASARLPPSFLIVALAFGTYLAVVLGRSVLGIWQRTRGALVSLPA
ncbi:MAG TPA: metal ABC transporter permease [Candidatus Dormibacteraeota bacterium]